MTVWLNTSGYKHTLTICNTATIAARTRLTQYYVLSTLPVLSSEDADGLAAHMLGVHSVTK